MKAEDTMMTNEQIKDILCPDRKGWGILFAVFPEHRLVAQVQAKITWDAREPEIDEARKAGIREVLMRLWEEIPNWGLEEHRLVIRTVRANLLNEFGVQQESQMESLKLW